MAPPPAAAAPDVFALRALFNEYLPHFGRVAAQAGRDAQVDYLNGRLREAERITADAKAHAARLAAELQAQTARADLLAGELEASQAALVQQRQAVASLTDELKGQRLFAMQAIEMGRAETGLAKDRAAELQARIDRLEMTIDQLRIARRPWRATVNDLAFIPTAAGADLAVATAWQAVDTWLEAVRHNGGDYSEETARTYRYHVAKLRRYCERTETQLTRWTQADANGFVAFLRDMPADCLCRRIEIGRTRPGPDGGIHPIFRFAARTSRGIRCSGRRHLPAAATISCAARAPCSTSCTRMASSAAIRWRG